MTQPVFDAETGALSGHNEFGQLPEWNLSDLYAAPDAPELKRDMDWLEGACQSFAADYEGKLATLDAQGLLDAETLAGAVDASSSVSPR